MVKVKVKAYHLTLYNTPEERKSHQHRGGSLKSRTDPICVADRGESVKSQTDPICVADRGGSVKSRTDTICVAERRVQKHAGVASEFANCGLPLEDF
jgi:hypothetical protein